MAAVGLCAAAALVWILPRDSDPEKRSRAGIPSDLTTPGVQPNNDTRSTDPSRALTRAFRLADRSERDNRVRELLSKWVARDAEAAMNWISSLEDSASRNFARTNVCQTLAESDPRRAVTLALAHGVEEEDGGLLECLTMQWCEKECESAVDWAREQPPGEWRERLLSRASFVLSKSDPAAAAHIVSNLESGHVQEEAAMAVLHQWALKDPASALRWAQEFPEGTLRERALAEISNLRNLATSLHEAD